MVFIIQGIFGGVTGAVRQVAHFVSSSVSRGLGAVKSYSSVRDLVAGVTETDWTKQYDIFKSGKDAWSRISDIPSEYIVTDEFALDTSFAYKGQNVMRLKLSALDLDTGEFLEKWVTVESDKKHSREAWIGMASDSVSESLAGYNYEVIEVLDYEYLQRV